jgi:hypothetical protein
MAHVVGMLLLHCNALETFKVFGNMVLTYDTIYNFYKMNLLFVKPYYKVFWRILKELDLQLWSELMDPDEITSCSVFLFGWIMSVFT